MTTMQPTTLYHNHEMSVHKKQAKTAASPAKTDQKTAVPPTPRIKNATTKIPSIEP